MLITLHCHYPGTPLPPTSVTVQPGQELAATPEAVHEVLTRLIQAGGRFELPIVGGPPLGVWAETVREVVVRG